MPRYVQRYPFAPKAVWWKRYDTKAALKLTENYEIKQIEGNAYYRKFAFDCNRDGDQQDTTTQPLKGLIVDSSYLTLKTHNFTAQQDMPQKEDILYYQGKFWIIEETNKSFVYTPKERLVLFVVLKSLK